MARRTKTFEIGDSKFVTEQLSAVDGCFLLENFEDALRVFCTSMGQEVKQITRKHYIHKTPERAFYALVAHLAELGPDKFEKFFETLLHGVYKDNNPMSYTNLESNISASISLISSIIQYNFYEVWMKKRFEIDGSSSEEQRVSGRVQKATEEYSQSHMLYAIQTADMASYNDLSNNLNTEAAFSLYETLCRKYVIEDEARKQAEREAQRNQ